MIVFKNAVSPMPLMRAAIRPTGFFEISDYLFLYATFSSLQLRTRSCAALTLPY